MENSLKAPEPKHCWKSETGFKIQERSEAAAAGGSQYDRFGEFQFTEGARDEITLNALEQTTSDVTVTCTSP